MPTSPQAWSPAAGPNTATPSARICATLRCVGGDSHIWRFIAGGHDQRHRARQAQRAEQVVGVTVGEAGEEVGGRRGDQDRVGVAAEVDVRHVVGHARIPQVGPHRVAGKRLVGHRGHEARPASLSTT